jgi:hypothetical protein
MTDNGELHVVFGTGAVGMSVMDELIQRGPRRVRMVNRSGRARVPHGVEVVGGDATDETFTWEVSVGASVVYFALNPPYNKWPELFPRCKPACWRARRRPGRSSSRWRTSTCTDPRAADR